MSKGSLELVYRAVDAINRRQVPDFRAPDAPVETPSTAVTGGTGVGEQGWREWIDEFLGAFAGDARMQVDEIIAAGEDYVGALVSTIGRGASSGLPLTLRWAGAWWVRDGQLVRAAGFLHTREAPKAVGLEE